MSNYIDDILVVENNLVTCPCCNLVMLYSDYLIHINHNLDNSYNQYNDNLYNSMINRGFDNDIMESDIQNENSLNDIGIGIKNLSLHSTQVTIIEDSYCVICMDTYNEGKTFYLMKCMHSFCDDCSRRWFDFKSVCPLCKTNIKK